MLVADGGPAHHWQAAGRHGQEAEACRALLLHSGMQVWRWADVVYRAQQQQSQVGVLLSSQFTFSSMMATK